MAEEKTTKEQVKPDVISQQDLRKYIVPEERAEKWISLKYEAKDEVLTFLNTLDRVDLMRFQDAKQFDGTDCADAVWEAVNDSEWCRDYPMGEYTYQERIPSIVKETMGAFDVKKLEERVEGIQKKLDKIEKLLGKKTITMTIREALKL